MNIPTTPLPDNDYLSSEFAQAKMRAAELDSRKSSQQKRNPKLPLQREFALPNSFPFDALGPILGPAAQKIHEVVRAPDSICGQSILATAAFVTQPHGNVHIDGRVHPISLFLLTVAESGDRKSAVDSIALEAVREYEKQLLGAYKE